jgi:hypothetical protein
LTPGGFAAAALAPSAAIAAESDTKMSSLRMIVPPFAR